MTPRIARSISIFLLAASFVSAADLSGIWTGQQQGRRGEPEDVAFRFKMEGQSLTGKMFGDEFDLPISEGSISGDAVRFTVTTTNYYSGGQIHFVYSGTIKGGEMELTRERLQTPEEKAANRPAANRPPLKQTLKLKRLT